MRCCSARTILKVVYGDHSVQENSQTDVLQESV